MLIERNKIQGEEEGEIQDGRKEAVGGGVEAGSGFHFSRTS